MKWWLVLIAMLVAAGAMADGMYAKSRVGPPANIKHQQAFLAWKDGKEWLIVGSVVQADGGNVGWVMPLPSRPTAIRAVDESALSDTDYRLPRPSIVGSKDVVGWVLYLPLSLMCGWIAWRRLTRPDWGWRDTFQALLVGAFLTVFLVLFFPVFATSKSASTSLPVTVAQAQRIGDFDVQVLRATSSKELTDWLTKAGCAMPEGAEPIVADYLRQRFVFVVAKLATTSQGEFKPDSLLFEFASDKPFYPMRLTGLQREPMVLDLTVFAPGEAKVYGLRQWGVQRLGHWYGGQRPDSDVAEAIGYRGLLFDDATATRLRSEVADSAMGNDLRIEIGEPATKTKRTKLAKTSDLAKLALIQGFVLALPALMLCVLIVRAFGGSPSLALKVGLTLAIVAGLAPAVTSARNWSPTEPGIVALRSGT